MPRTALLVLRDSKMREFFHSILSRAGLTVTAQPTFETCDSDALVIDDVLRDFSVPWFTKHYPNTQLVVCCRHHGDVAALQKQGVGLVWLLPAHLLDDKPNKATNTGRP